MRETEYVLVTNGTCRAGRAGLACGQEYGVCCVLPRICAHHGGTGFWRRRYAGRLRRPAAHLVPSRAGIAAAVAYLHNAFERKLYVAVGIAGVVVWGSAVCVQLELHAVGAAQTRSESKVRHPRAFVMRQGCDSIPYNRALWQPRRKLPLRRVPSTSRSSDWKSTSSC